MASGDYWSVYVPAAPNSYLSLAPLAHFNLNPTLPLDYRAVLWDRVLDSEWVPTGTWRLWWEPQPRSSRTVAAEPENGLVAEVPIGSPTDDGVLNVATPISPTSSLNVPAAGAAELARPEVECARPEVGCARRRRRLRHFLLRLGCGGRALCS